MDATLDRLSYSPIGEFGANVRGDLSEPLSDAEQRTLRQRFLEFEMLVFRDQRLSHPRQVEIMEYIAPVLHTAEGMHFVSTNSETGVLGTAELPFHSDICFLAHPRPALSLHAIDVVTGGSSTRFASSTRPLSRLPQLLIEQIRGLRAVHVFPLKPYNDPDFDGEFPAWLPRQSHPVLMPHPATGHPILYVTELQTVRIEGMTIAAGRALLDELRSYVYAERNVFEHVWRNGDMVMWDNLAAQHARGDLRSVGPRTLQKVQSGAESFESQWSRYWAAPLQAALGSVAQGN